MYVTVNYEYDHEFDELNSVEVTPTDDKRKGYEVPDGTQYVQVAFRGCEIIEVEPSDYHGESIDTEREINAYDEVVYCHYVTRKVDE